MSMTSVAAPIWNGIAKTQTLKTPWARRTFKMTGNQMAEAENEEYQSLKLRVGNEVATAYADVKPLLLENVAISRYIQEQGDQDLRQALPEVISIAEAIALASMERPLSRKQQTSLASLLRADYR